MAHSAIRYQNNTQYIQDALLGGVLKYIFIAADRKVSENPCRYGWLLEAINKWWGDFEDMPPGLKDIELDVWLFNEERMEIFREILSLSYEGAPKELIIEIMKINNILG